MKLPDKLMALVEAALNELSARQVKASDVIEIIKEKIRNEEALLEAERGIVGIALLGAGMQLGPPAFSTLVVIARQLGVEGELQDASLNFQFGKPPNVQVMPKGTPHNGRCESLWRPDLPCPNPAEFIIRNKSNDGYAVMCGPHKDGFFEQYRGNDVVVEPYDPQKVVKPPR